MGSTNATANTAVLNFGAENPGIIATTTIYDGSTWSTGSSLGTARGNGAGAGTATTALCMGGNTTGDTNATEEYTSVTTAQTVTTS